MENIKRIDENTIEVDGIVYKAEEKRVLKLLQITHK